MATKTKIDYDTRTNLGKLLTGKVLAIDPASGASSLPGYALFDKGDYTEYGVLEIPKHKKLHRRLHYLQKTLKESFEQPDVLLIESIPVRGHGRHAGAHSSLLKAVGVIVSVWDCVVVEVPIPTWKAYVRRTKDEDYKEKRDDLDALMIGKTVMEKARNMEACNE